MKNDISLLSVDYEKYVYWLIVFKQTNIFQNVDIDFKLPIVW
jgi:hypothetical protein